MKINTKLISIILLFTVVLSLSYAQVEITDVNTPFFVKQGDLVRTRVYIGNAGQANERVFTTIQITGKNYFHEYKTSPMISKVGRESVISLLFKAPELPGEYRLTVKAYNENVNFERDYRFKVISESKDFEVGLCSKSPVIERGESRTIFICLANTGTESDDFVVTTEGWTNHKINQRTHQIDSSQEVSIPITIYTDIMDIPGDHTLTVSTRAVRGGVEKSVEVPIHIISTDKVDINTEITTTSSIAGETIHMNLTLINRGRANIYSVNITYPDNWKGEQMDVFNVFLKTNEERVVKLEFTPREHGTYPMSLEINTDEGLVYSREFRITSFKEADVGFLSLTGAFLRVGEGRAPLYIFFVLLTLIGAFIFITYFLNKERGYYIYPKRENKDKDINIELQ